MGKFIRRLQVRLDYGAHFTLFSRSAVV